MIQIIVELRDEVVLGQGSRFCRISVNKVAKLPDNFI